MSDVRSRNIAITGVGALIGQGIAKALKHLDDITTIGVDRKITLLSESFCNTCVQKPNCTEDSAAYLQFWLDFIKDKDIALIIPGISHDMNFFLKNSDTFANCGVQIVLNDPKLIALTQDKFKFDAVYRTLGLPTIPTATPSTWQKALEILGPAPLLLKPRIGEGSAGIVLLHDELDFNYWTKKAAENWMLQKIIGQDDQEFTVGTFGFGDGTSLKPIIFRRTLSRSGHTQEATVVEHKAITSITRKIVQHFKPIGPTNLQFRVQDDTPYLLEINPRFSSSCSLRTAFGYNEAIMCIQYYLDGIKPAEPEIKFGFGQRYNEDNVTYARHSI
jgi:carbamoyl-phosphate synthase large subunit